MRRSKERYVWTEVPDYDPNTFNILTVLIAFYSSIFLPQYVLNTNCEPEDDLK
jgi:hypothetical protein